MKGIERRVACRSFFLETLWNYEKFQNVGFVYCIHPVLERLYPDPEQRKEAVQRHLEKVNTHPLMGPFLVGVAARLEHQKGRSAARSYRVPLMAALASHGDRIFWGHVKPLAAVAGLLGCLYFLDSVLGSVIFLLVYNVPHLFVRGIGFGKGWEKGLGALAEFHSPRVEMLIRLMSRCIAIGAGVATGLLVLRLGSLVHGTEAGSMGPWLSGIMVIVAAVGFGLVRAGLAVELAIGAVAASTAVAVLWL
ncbi:MAG: PTS system mannose/fructose/sorbose family transporter subunit IID [Thermodesulfobacteriota bacterium]